MAAKKWGSAGWGYDTGFYRRKQWLNLRKKYIEGRPLCELCEQWDIVSEGVYVDHIIPRRLAPDLEYNEANLQTLCRDCHGKKTALERSVPSLADYIKEMSKGKLRFICTEDKKKYISLVT